jgi:hypothetical protein
MFNIFYWIMKSKLFRKLNKILKLSTLITILSKLIQFFPFSITIRLLWALLKLSIFIVGATTMYFTSSYGGSKYNIKYL